MMAAACANQPTVVRQLLPLIVFAATLVGCALPRSNPTPAPDAPDPSASSLYLDAVRGLVGQGQYYAAIAHIQEDRHSHGDTAELRLLEADARRNLGQSKLAEDLYLGLLNGAKAGEAHHGLGRLLAAPDPDTSLRHLREAARLRPTDVDIRNDFGFALMQARRYPEARVELATAAELAPGEAKSRNNLLILLMLMQDEAAVRRIAAQTGVDAALLARLRVQAQSLKTPKARAIGAGSSGINSPVRTGDVG